MPDQHCAQNPSPAERPHLHHNWQDWLPYLEHTDASEAEKRALIEAVWNIVTAFADLGWDIGPHGPDQPETCGKAFDLAAVLQVAMIYSETQEKEEV